MASGNMLLIIHQTGAPGEQQCSLHRHFCSLATSCKRVAKAEPNSSPETRKTSVFWDKASTLLGSGFPVVFEFEFEQITTSTEHSKYMAFSVCKTLKHVMEVESHSGASLRERSMPSASEIFYSLISDVRMTQVNTWGHRTRERGLRGCSQAMHTETKGLNPKAGLPLSSPS